MMTWRLTVQTGEISVCLRLRGVEQRVPAAFISDTELRFMTPDFQARAHAEITPRSSRGGATPVLPTPRSRF